MSTQTKRKAMSKKTRFEVFKRDSFKCQYCGSSAPAAVLVVDHIDPISKAGADEMFNYITACQPCNAGKSDRKLSDDSILQKQKTQIDELSERREQLEMMMQWRDGLMAIEDDALNAVAATWSLKLCRDAYHLNESGLQQLRQLLAKFSAEEVLDAMLAASTYYFEYDVSGKLTQESVQTAWSKLKGICCNKREGVDRHVYYVRAIVRKKFQWADDAIALSLIKDLKRHGADDATLRAIAVDAGSWTQWKNWMYECIARFGSEAGE